MSHPMAVTNCNIDMEALISDHNRSIATLAITTLLKTGNENSIERLIKQVSSCSSTDGLPECCAAAACHGACQPTFASHLLDSSNKGKRARVDRRSS